MSGPTKCAQLLEQFEMGEVGDVEFVELALDAGLSIEKIEKALAQHRCDMGLSAEEAAQC